MRNLIIFSLLLFLVASINFDSFADHPQTDHPQKTVLVDFEKNVTTDLATSFEVSPVVIIFTSTSTKNLNRENTNLLTYTMPKTHIDINRADCNYPTTSFLPVSIQRSYSELSTKDYTQRNTNVVPKNISSKNISSPVRTRKS